MKSRGKRVSDMDKGKQHFIYVRPIFEAYVNEHNAVFIDFDGGEYQVAMYRHAAAKLRDWLNTVLSIEGLVSS